MSEHWVLWPALCSMLTFWRGGLLQERWVFLFFDVDGLLLEYGLRMTGNVLWCVRLDHREQFQSMVGDFYQTALW